MAQPANVRLVTEDRLAADLGGKSDVGHGHAVGDVSGLSASLASKADLVGGVVPSTQIPAIALTKPTPVADRAAMLALAAQEGDVAVITAGADKGSYMLGTGSASTFASWVKLTTPDAPVQSVNGQSGTVTLSKADVDLGNVDNTSDAAKPISTATQTALDGKAGAARAGFVGWYGTTAEYNALPAGTRNAAGFIAVITP